MKSLAGLERVLGTVQGRPLVAGNEKDSLFCRQIFGDDPFKRATIRRVMGKRQNGLSKQVSQGTQKKLLSPAVLKQDHIRFHRPAGQQRRLRPGSSKLPLAKKRPGRHRLRGNHGDQQPRPANPHQKSTRRGSSP